MKNKSIYSKKKQKQGKKIIVNLNIDDDKF